MTCVFNKWQLHCISFHCVNPRHLEIFGKKVPFKQQRRLHCENMQKTYLSMYCSAVASGTATRYGTVSITIGALFGPACLVISFNLSPYVKVDKTSKFSGPSKTFLHNSILQFQSTSLQKLFDLYQTFLRLFPDSTFLFQKFLSQTHNPTDSQAIRPARYQAWSLALMQHPKQGLGRLGIIQEKKNLVENKLSNQLVIIKPLNSLFQVLTIIK